MPTSCLHKTVLVRETHDSQSACAPTFSPNLTQSMVHCASNILHILAVLICCQGH